MSRETMAATQGHRGTSRKFGRVTVGRLYDERVDERVDIMMPFTLVTMPHHARQSKPTTTRIAVSMPLLRSGAAGRSEEHTSELQSRINLVCRLLLEKKKLLP